MLKYEKKSLFDVSKGSYLAHACNAQGVWGSGIATMFKRKFPNAFVQYSKLCRADSDVILGTSFIVPDGDFCVVCMIVSEGYGHRKSSKEEILFYTKHAIESLLNNIPDGSTIYSNKFNSGFFAVPWLESEKVLQEGLKNRNINWIVCDPEL